MSPDVRHDVALEPAAIRAAGDRIHPAFLNSPQFVHDGLSARAGRPVVVKVESVNPIRAFKGRGTWLAIRELAGEGRIGADRPVVVASTGNFGQGIAFAGRAFRVPVTVFADANANAVKLDRIRAFGATVRQEGRDFDDARAAAETYATDTGAVLLVDGAEPLVAAGAGTLAVELTDAAERGDLPPLDTAWIPVGNGALIVGIGAWLRHARPSCRVIGVQSEAAPSMALSFRAGEAVETETAATFADGIATRVPVPEALDMMRSRVDEVVLVSEEALKVAQAELTAALAITVEGAAAASWAALLDAPPDVGTALVLITGSNVR